MAITRKDAKQLLTESVRELAEKKTINKICVTEIARNCDMSTSNFYYYFSDKYELIAYVICSEIDERVSHTEMPIQDLLFEFIEMMDGSRNFYTNILASILMEYPNHLFFHEMLDSKIKDLIVTHCMNSRPSDQTDLILHVYLAGLTAAICSHVINHRKSRSDLMDAFITAIPDTLRPMINTGTYLS